MHHARSVILSIIGILGVLAFAGCSGRSLEAATAVGQSTRTTQDAVGAATSGESPAQIVAGQRPCGLWLDGTGSLDPAIRLAAVEQIAYRLPSIAASEGLGPCEVYEWGDKPWSAVPFYKFVLPRNIEPVREVVKCAGAPENEASKLFKPSKKRSEDKANALCSQKQLAADQRYETAKQRDKNAYERAMTQTIADLKRVLLSRAPLDVPCTSVTDHLMRIARSRGPMTVISVTDAIESCRSALAPVEPPTDDVRLIVVLVDPKKPSAPTLAEDFLRRQHELMRVAPWIKVIVPFWRFDGAVADAALDTEAVPHRAKGQQ